MQRLCQTVLLAACVGATAPGCWAFHGRSSGTGVDAGSRRDGGRRPVDGGDPRADASWDADGGPEPSCGGTYSDARITRACPGSITGHLWAGRDDTLTVSIDGECFCAHQLRCGAEVTGPFQLALHTEICDPRLDCDGCAPTLEAECAIPPLEEGTWRVTVNGLDAFDVEARVPPPRPIDGREVCHTVAPALDGPSLICAWPGDWAPPSLARMCHPAGASPGWPFEITVMDTCGGCFDAAGQCEVEITAEGTILLRPERRSCECPVCGACAEVCSVVEVSCWVPALAEGEYEVVVEGSPLRDTVTVDPAAGGETVCVETLTGG